MSSTSPFFTPALALLEALIATPSFSREEGGTAELIASFLTTANIPIERQGHNVWARSRHWDAQKPTLLLNSHHDTVKPVAGWQRDPFTPTWEGEHLYGLGSNDAGGPLVALLAVFAANWQRQDLACNLVVAATAEEEISGSGGIAAILPALGPLDAAIVGEPTQLQMAVAEKGLLVVDAVAQGRAGHAAREEGINAIYRALDDVAKLRQLQLPAVSPLLGPVKFTVTQMEGGRQHNVVPDTCRYVIDIRTNECYTNAEVFALLRQELEAELTARSFRLNSSRIALEHPLVRAGLALGLPYYGSPTLSDQALLPIPSLKLGCGDSARSHTADEYLLRSELAAGIATYQQLLDGLDWG